mmetsp:Transcript_5512/g.10356  ORF Transcript_5512/g.10356 Transcript_5512/m.10356 type:complete len:234 (+) Transcript_5512:143-844(+)
MQGMGGPEELLSFKAGRMTATRDTGKKFTVEADPRKGKLCLVRTVEGLLHVQWKLRAGNKIEEDLLVSPQNQTFSKVDTGRANDRVYILQFANSSRRFFFWMQEPDADKDTSNCQKMNEYFVTPPAAGGQSGGAFGDADPNALMQLLSQFHGNEFSQGGSGRQLDVEDVSSVIQGMNAAMQQQGGGGSGQGRSGSSSSDDDDDNEEKSGAGEGSGSNNNGSRDDEGKDDEFYN